MTASSSPASTDPSSEVSLIRAVQTGDAQASEAFSQLIKKYEPLIESILSRSVQNDEDLRGDARTAAYEGFWKAVKHFKPERGRSLGVFARKYVHGAVIRFFKAEVLAWQNNRITLDDTILGDETFEDSVAQQIDVIEITEAVQAFVRSLPLRYQKIITDVIYEGRLQSDVARECGVGRSAVNNILHKVRLRGQEDLAAFEPRFCPAT